MSINPSYLLINTPLTDPSSPYHSISYLIGAATAHGYLDFECIDANIDMLNHLADPMNTRSLLERANSYIAMADELPRLSRVQQVHYRRALMGTGLTPAYIAEAVSVLRNPDEFYDYDLYQRAVMIVKRWWNLLVFDRIHYTNDPILQYDVSLIDFDSLESLANTDMLEAFVSPYRAYFDNPFRAAIASKQFDLIGLSVNYASQLPFAVFMAKMIKQISPESFLCIGGTEISDISKYLEPSRSIFEIFASCDGIVVGEGETPFTEILSAISQGQPDSIACVPGILTKKNSPLRSCVSPSYEALESLPSPRYDVWDWSSYWAPEPIVLYSPTRGCYWNKCTFCDYGLNTDAPTSPSRERPIEILTQELCEISKIGGVVLFAVDAISPSYLNKICDTLIDNRIPIQWSAEIRLEKKFRSRTYVERLKKSGCISASFGLESASPRILKLLDKGIDIEIIPAIIKNFWSAGIGVELMCFTGFPTETEEEATQTENFLREHKNHWSLAAVGNYELTDGSIVAKSPDSFGIEIECGWKSDIRRRLRWREKGKKRTRCRQPSNIKDLQEFKDDRPFLGGLSCGHTLLYFKKFGKQLKDNNSTSYSSDRLNTSKNIQTSYSNIRSFAKVGGHEALGEGVGSLPTKELRRWLLEKNVENTFTSTRIEILPNGEFFETPWASSKSGSQAFRHLKDKLISQ